MSPSRVASGATLQASTPLPASQTCHSINCIVVALLAPEQPLDRRYVQPVMTPHNTRIVFGDSYHFEMQAWGK
jgi:hypothetical protein